MDEREKLIPIVSAANTGAAAGELLRIRVGPEDFHEFAVLAQLPQSFGYGRIANVALDIGKEVILPRLSFAGTRLNFGHVDLGAGNRRQGPVERPDLVHGAEHDAGSIAASRRAAFPAEHEEASGVG